MHSQKGVVPIAVIVVVTFLVGGALLAGFRQTMRTEMEVTQQEQNDTPVDAEPQATSNSVEVTNATPNATPGLKSITISGFAYEDRNDDGIFNSDDPKIPYMQLYLYDSYNPNVQITTLYSATDGGFSHTMQVRGGILVKPTAYNNFVPKTGSKTYMSSNNSLQFGFRSASAPVPGQNVGIIEGDIFHDANRNLVRDSGENPVPFYKLYLTDGTGNYFNAEAYPNTDNGHFKYSNLQIGKTYTLTLSNPTGAFDILQAQKSISLSSTHTEDKDIQIPVYKY